MGVLTELRLLIATHTHGVVTPAYCQSLAMCAAELAHRGVKFAPVLFGDSLVDRGRDRAAATLLAGDWTHLLFVDADIEFTVEDVLKLIAAGKDIAVAAYRNKRDDVDFAVQFFPEARESLDECPDTGAIKIMRAGTGFMLIRRCVFERLAEAMPELTYTEVRHTGEERPMTAFFEHIRLNGRRWSEDFAFCDRWRSIGGEVWMVPNINLGHWGAHVWRGSIDEYLEDVA